jgi:hypothetical protein
VGFFYGCGACGAQRHQLGKPCHQSLKSVFLIFMTPILLPSDPDFAAQCFILKYRLIVEVSINEFNKLLSCHFEVFIS